MFDWFKHRIVEVVQWFSDLFVAVFSALFDLLKDAICWVLEQFLHIAVNLLGSIDVSGLTGYSGAWGSLPADIINIMGLLGFGPAAAIIVSASLIRLYLQLVPFTRLGS